MVRCTELFTILPKPGDSTVTEYKPGGSDRRIATPSALVVAFREMPLVESAAVTEAPRTTAPFGSFTMTCNSEVCTWATAPATRNAVTTSTQNSLRAKFILFSSDENCCTELGGVPWDTLRCTAMPAVVRPCD